MPADGLCYRLSLPRPADHLVSVEVAVPCAGLPDDHVDLTMAAWSPGSYLVRDYARFVRDLTATGDDGAPRAARKFDKSTWRIERAGAARVTVRYQVYGHDLTVRTNHIDPTHALLHGPATYLYAPHLRAAPARVEVDVPAGWHLATALAPGGAADGRPVRLTAASVDELLDSPIHVGLGERRAFTAAGVPFELAVWGDLAPGGLYTLDQLAVDLAAIAGDHAERAGEVPFESLHLRPHGLARRLRRPRAPGVVGQPDRRAVAGHPQGLRAPARAPVARAVPRLERQADSRRRP